jgi:hypothetical protein
LPLPLLDRNSLHVVALDGYALDEVRGLGELPKEKTIDEYGIASLNRFEQ